MTGLDATVTVLLALGEVGHRPAGAVVGVRTPAGSAIAAGGWARLPDDEGPGEAMTPGTLLDLASVTKAAATTVLLMRLVADGVLDLADPVRTHLPGWSVAGSDAVTVEHLLTHTSGLPPWLPLYARARDRDRALRAVEQTPLSTAPGTAWCYSDLGLVLAGRLVEQVTGLGLAEAYQRLVAGPLGLTDTGFGPVDPARAAVSADSDAYELAMVATGRPYPVPSTAAAFTGWRDRPIRGVVQDGNAAHALDGVSGHAGLFGTVADLLRLGSAVRSGFVPRDVLDRFARPCAVHPEQAVGFRRRTVEVDGEPLVLLWHGGFTGTFWGFTPDLAGEPELVVAGGATRLHGTLGPLPADLPAADDPLPPVVPTQAISDVLVAGALAALRRPPSPGEER